MYCEGKSKEGRKEEGKEKKTKIEKENRKRSKTNKNKEKLQDRRPPRTPNAGRETGGQGRVRRAASASVQHTLQLRLRAEPCEHRGRARMGHEAHAGHNLGSGM